MSLPLHIITIVLDGFPFITWHYPILRQLKLDWHWHVVEGVALPVKDTSWCARLEPRLSTDGTFDYLRELSKFDSRVTHIHQPSWPGKVAMFNEAMGGIKDGEFLLLQMDSDEIWTKRQLEKLYELLLPKKLDNRNCAYFRCRYFVGPDRVIISRHGFGNHEAYEWHRAWRVPSGTLFDTHEPPKLSEFEARPYLHGDTEAMRLVFDHYAYATEAQMRFKERYYGSPANPNGHLYKNAAANWKRLQQAPLPILQLNEYFPWVGEGVTVDRA
jgi:glycosyl transferase family 2